MNYKCICVKHRYELLLLDPKAMFDFCIIFITSSTHHFKIKKKINAPKGELQKRKLSREKKNANQEEEKMDCDDGSVGEARTIKRREQKNGAESNVMYTHKNEFIYYRQVNRQVS